MIKSLFLGIICQIEFVTRDIYFEKSFSLYKKNYTINIYA